MNRRSQITQLCHLNDAINAFVFARLQGRRLFQFQCLCLQVVRGAGTVGENLQRCDHLRAKPSCTQRTGEHASLQSINRQPGNRQPVNRHPVNRQPANRQPLNRQPVNKQTLLLLLLRLLLVLLLLLLLLPLVLLLLRLPLL